MDCEKQEKNAKFKQNKKTEYQGLILMVVIILADDNSSKKY